MSKFAKLANVKMTLAKSGRKIGSETIPLLKTVPNGSTFKINTVLGKELGAIRGDQIQLMAFDTDEGFFIGICRDLSDGTETGSSKAAGANKDLDTPGAQTITVNLSSFYGEAVTKTAEHFAIDLAEYERVEMQWKRVDRLTEEQRDELGLGEPFDDPILILEPYKWVDKSRDDEDEDVAGDVEEVLED